MTKVSIIVPVYNVEKYICECIDSLLKQTYKDIEIILVDDGSIDMSANICNEYMRYNTNVKTYHIKNSGPAVARNYGLTKAKGDYIMFVDADDWIEQDTISKCCEILEKMQCDMVFFNMCDFEKERICEFRTLKGKERNFEEKEISYLEDMLLTFKGENPGGAGALGGPVCKLIRRDIANKCHFPNELSFGEDTCFVEQVLQKSKAISYINEIFYHRRVLKDSLSHAHRLDYGDRRLGFVNWTLRFYKEKKSYELLNEFCFQNYCAVVERSANNKCMDYLEKKKHCKDFLERMQFKYNFSAIKIEQENKKVRLIRELIKKEHLMIVFIIFKILQTKNEFLENIYAKNN